MHTPKKIDMNKLTIRQLENQGGFSQQNYGISSKNITVHFKELDKRLIEYIRNADGVLGAVAWLNHRAILRELAKKEAVTIIIQKEEWQKKPRPKYEDYDRETIKLYKNVPEFKWQLCLDG